MILKTEKKKLSELTFIFCTDDFLLKINQDYLKHNTYTDIVTFDLSNTGEAIRGEIYISLDRVRENATIFNNSLSKELLRVIFHGVLHLCGYNDKLKVDVKEMRSKENHYLKMYQAFVSREMRST